MAIDERIEDQSESSFTWKNFEYFKRKRKAER